MFFTENPKKQTGSSGKQKKAEIVKMIQELSGSHNPYKIFSDWIAMYAIAIQNSCRIKNALWQEREKRYLELIGQYEKEERFQIAELCGRLVEVMQETEITDWLAGSVGGKRMEDGKEKRGKESGTVAAVPEAGSRAYDTCGNQVEKVRME